MIQKLKIPRKINCNISINIIEKRNIQKISLLNRIELKLHKLNCKGCSVYHAQSTAIEKLINANFDQLSIQKDDVLEANLKQQILEDLNL